MDNNGPSPEETEEPSSQEPVNTDIGGDASTQLPKKKGKLTKKNMLLAAAFVLLLGSAAGAYFMLLKNDKSKTASNQPAASTPETKEAAESETISPELQAQITRFISPETGEKWYDTPKSIALQGYTNTSGYTEDAEYTEYYEVGTRGSSTIILGIIDEAGRTMQLYEKASDGKIKAILHPDANGVYKEEFDNNYEFRSDIAIDKTQHYDTLSIPRQLSIGNSETITTPEYPTLGNFDIEDVRGEGVKVTIVKKFGASTLVRTERTYADTKLTAIGYQIRTPIWSDISLPYEPIANDFDGYKWDNGVSVTGGLGGIVRGCGAGISVSRADGVTDSDFVKAGTTASGQQLYVFKSSDAGIVQKAYQETKDYYAGTDEKKADITLADFVKNHAVFAYKSPNAGWLIYTSDDYAPIGGCAKPVVYLYPSFPQQVSVKVGADVKISNPMYKGGWNIFAWPNGQLLVDNQKYDSLFWEGPGHGSYPAITSGTVVKFEDAEKTIRKQLVQQGLNTKETQDFMDYWAPHIPNKPYVRLAWFDTTQLDELAPLTITPKPNTVIRVFLDMAGLDSSISMAAPSFNAPLRTGFTAVEWGGLSLTKLY